MNQINTAIIFTDLKLAFDRLQESKTSPSEVRRRFVNFLSLTQQLTNIMRKEYEQNTGKFWEAKNFDGWNKVSNLFKELRNEDYHEFPANIDVKCTSHFQIFEGDPHKVHTIYKSEMFQLSDNLPTPPNLKMGDKFYEAFKHEYSFILQGRTSKINKLLNKIESNEIHQLSIECFELIERYYQFYKKCLSENFKPPIC